MEEKDLGRKEEAYIFFCRNLPVIHQSLTGLYGIGAAHASLLEQNISLWFDRFVRRPGSAHVPVKSLRLPLLVATCRTGLTFQLCKFDGNPCPDQKLREILAQDPEDVALELEHKIQHGLNLQQGD